MPASSADRRLRVRIFPDYADTVLWFGGPLEYDEAGLTDELTQGLMAWEQFYYDALSSNFQWKSAELARQFTEEGNRLAQLLAEELGLSFEVEFEFYEERTAPRRYRGNAPAVNPGAEAAFKIRADAIVQEQQEIARIQSERNEEGH